MRELDFDIKLELISRAKFIKSQKTINKKCPRLPAHENHADHAK